MQTKFVSSRTLPEDEYPKSLAKWLSLIQITLGLSSMALFTVAVIICRVINIHVAASVLFIISGMLNLISARYPSRGILVAVATVAVLATVASLMFLHSDSSSKTCPRFHGFPVLQTLITWEILQGVLLFICLVEGILSTVFLVLASRSLCSCCQTQVFIIPYNASGTSTNSETLNNGSDDSENAAIYLSDYNPPPPEYKEVV